MTTAVRRSGPCWHVLLDYCSQIWSLKYNGSFVTDFNRTSELDPPGSLSIGGIALR